MSTYRRRRRGTVRWPDRELFLSAAYPDDRTRLVHLGTDRGSSA
jgi:hypothetical protein